MSFNSIITHIYNSLPRLFPRILATSQNYPNKKCCGNLFNIWKIIAVKLNIVFARYSVNKYGKGECTLSFLLS